MNIIYDFKPNDDVWVINNKNMIIHGICKQVNLRVYNKTLNETVNEIIYIIKLNDNEYGTPFASSDVFASLSTALDELQMRLL